MSKFLLFLSPMRIMVFLILMGIGLQLSQFAVKSLSLKTDLELVDINEDWDAEEMTNDTESSDDEGKTENQLIDFLLTCDRPNSFIFPFQIQNSTEVNDLYARFYQSLNLKPNVTPPDFIV